MRYLGIDYGRKRIGIAISDEDGQIAFPKETVSEQAIVRIKKIIKEEGIRKVVIGLPKMPDGRETEETHEVRAFADKLRKSVKIPVVFEDELFTTRIVRGEGMKKNQTDRSAAALILQSYLDKQNAKRVISH